MRPPLRQDPLVTFASDVISPFDDVLEDATDLDMVSEGWRDILAGLAGAWAEVLRADGSHYRVIGISTRAGGLRVVSDVPEEGRPGERAMTEIRRLRSEAEDASLRTCELCGRFGVLRHWSGTFAVRCDGHVGIGAGDGHEAASTLSCAAVVENLMISHRDWVSHLDPAHVEVPRGWVPLVVEGFHRFRRLRTSRKLELLGMRAVLGRLEMRLEHEADDLAIDEVLDWQAAVLALGDAAAFTCDVCGAAGYLRATLDGVPAPRCDAHADYGRWHSHQWSAPFPDAQTRSVITSARRQLTLETVSGMASRPRPKTQQAGPEPSTGLALYHLDDVRSALGLANRDDDEGPERPTPADSEQQARLRAILDRGEAGAWRRLARPEPGMVDALDALGRRAPHLDGLTSALRRHLLAATTIGLPVALPPTLLVGAPGVGKTWFLSQVASVLGLPFVAHPMSGASHSDGVGGAHPVWRNAQPGAVAKILLGGGVANPVILVDEFDKVPPLAGVDDLYRPFYGLLEPAGAKTFVDAYLQFPIDASRVIWILAANSVAPIPAPILSRLTVTEVSSPGLEQSAAIAVSIYADANLRRLRFFVQAPPADVVARLVGLGPRAMRIAVEHAMTNAASQGRRDLRQEDLPETAPSGRARMGFV